MPANDDIAVDDRSPAMPSHDAGLAEIQAEVDRLRLAERVALTARADAAIEAASARRSLDRAMGEVDALAVVVVDHKPAWMPSASHGRPIVGDESRQRRRRRRCRPRWPRPSSRWRS